MVVALAAADAEGMATRRGRVWGYVAAVVVGLAIGGFLGYLAFLETFCALWGGQCTAAQNARVVRLAWAAVAAPVLVVGVYAVVERAVNARRGGRS